ncbi:MAG: FkbM family methyltransferase [bacterium]|nr:FkbM family methyltransferase [bacterium]
MLQRNVNLLRAFCSKARIWYRRAFKPNVIANRGILLRVNHPAISPRMRSVLYQDAFEMPEIRILEQTLSPGDRVLELGAGVGFVSVFASRICGSENVTIVEANPALTRLIEENHRLNRVSPRVIAAAAASHDRETESFFVATDFWASSTARESTQRIAVPAVNVNSLIVELNPSYLIMDIEGAESEIVPSLRLGSIQKILIELHPWHYGLAEANKVMTQLIRDGFVLDFSSSIKNQLFMRRAAPGSA